MLSYLSLFFSALLSATLLPGSSEALLLILLQDEQANLYLLWAMASFGNVLGSIINWSLGRFGYHWRHHKWFPVSAQALESAAVKYQRWGKASLLLAWVPIIGDPLTLIAGFLKTPFLHFVILVALGKSLRYALLIWLLA
ncbi:membrane protein YqaA, SNARE-associated domain [Oceanospirillum multiglobuliferum]|uniref:VTT domain-containing protein n=1 Tax=Oceanospirillum multiglobuliferum TaxID=64969 RepID=A0A1T4LXB9_9GAMM|nr:YqaA family protein [Oceanospirillum multiglobuliferum]OPX56334.1 hypothetical protein BTE48_05020 [Oceanospirillum multiglobuliferum]SJZ59104.1 membrane protein YqaA, SNARE-associated domain [Oceanospirillum multiglobuliferum]